MQKEGGEPPPLQGRTLGQINKIRNMPGIPVFQRNYYEHIIRNDNELSGIREYIVSNPLKWDEDEDNPLNMNCRGEVTSPVNVRVAYEPPKR